MSEEVSTSNTQSEDVSGVSSVVKPIFFISDVYNLATKPFIKSGEIVGRQIADMGIPDTSEIFTKAMQEKLLEVLVPEIQRILLDPELRQRMLDNGLMRQAGEILVVGLAEDAASATIIKHDPTIGLPLVALHGGVDAFFKQKEFYRDFVKMAGSINPQTGRPNLVGFAAVPFIYNEEGKESQEYTVLIDAGRTLGKFIAEEGRQKPDYMVVDADGKFAPPQVKRSLEKSEAFVTEVYEPAVYDAYNDMKNTFGFNMVDGKLDKAEYGLYIQDVLKNSKIMDEMAIKAFRDAMGKELFAEPNKEALSGNLNDDNKPVIAVAAIEEPPRSFGPRRPR